MALFIGRAGRELGLVALEAQIINVCLEAQFRDEHWGCAIDAPEQLIAKLVVERMLFFAGGLGNKYIDLRAAEGVDQLKAVELERDVRPGAGGNEPARAIGHFKSPAAEDEIVIRVGEVGELKVRKGLLQIDRILLDRRRQPVAAKLQARDPLDENPYVLVQLQTCARQAGARVHGVQGCAHY